MFDEDCCNIRRQLHYVKNLKECSPHNREIREQFYAIKIIFEKSVKKNKAAVKDELLNILNNFHDKDSQKYWDIFNILRDTKASTNNCFISAKQWVTHYKSLYHKPPDIDDDILDKLQEAEIIGKGNTILDYDINILHQFQNHHHETGVQSTSNTPFSVFCHTLRKDFVILPLHSWLFSITKHCS